ncbi:MAG: RNase P subunit p30 family protein [Methanobacterium sp.]|nr:RNase P subunit p30 family protein [Methanobacterium sp.]
MFFDFHIHGDLEVALNAGKLGYHGVVLTLCSRDCINHPETLKTLRKNVKKIKSNNGKNPPSIQIGVEIESQNPEDLKKKVSKFRKKTDVILVHGGDLKLNRAATEDPRVDILSHPYRTRFDSGINHVLAVKASENSVAIELNLKYYLLTRPSHRYRVLTQFRQIMKLHRKYKFPVIITSDAGTSYDLRDPFDVMALAACFGMTKEEAFEALSKTPQEIIRRNEIRDKIIIPGARFVR